MISTGQTTTEAKVDILLSTYNGEAYLHQQLGSILGQSMSNWRLLVRDDGSSDKTLDILQAYSEKDYRLEILASSGPNYGVVRSYMALLSSSTAPHFAFCDQDDYWLSEKLEIFLAHIGEGDSQIPRLVHSDLEVVDDSLNPIYKSFMSQQGFTLRSTSDWKNNLLQNSVVGCATIGNAVLRDLMIQHAPDNWSDVVMHDWWACLVASCFGRVDYVDTPTALYRQHTDNQLGTKENNFKRYLKSVVHERPVRKVRNYLQDASAQARAFRHTFADKLPAGRLEELDMLIDVANRRSLSRVYGLLRCYRRGIRMRSTERDLMVLLASLAS